VSPRNFLCIVGARPNFMKMAPILTALHACPGVGTVLAHTGQHYDENLSDVFFTELGIPRPDVTLDVGSASHGVQTARVLEGCERILLDAARDGRPFERVIVVGDVNSTMAAALAAAKLGIPVAHVEAGLRSFDRSMPEEINRVVTDSVADCLLVSEPAGMDNLRREGHFDAQLHLVGNVMIDTLRRLLPAARRRDTLARWDLQPGEYGVVTLHRPSNVDNPRLLAGWAEVLVEASRDVRLVFPVHPRTRQRLEQLGLGAALAEGRIQILPPLGYLDCLALTSQARLIITDSGGLQEESTALGIPCLTARTNTERPITVEQGTSTLVGSDPQKLRSCLRAILEGRYKPGRCPPLWDGHAATRIARILTEGSLKKSRTESRHPRQVPVATLP
jgi:UDP-N-acetylglucosamine 2-epimerase (non-hydrolysing)